jgi:pimeloyl-ACP methyl ester carboxylesterase
MEFTTVNNGDIALNVAVEGEGPLILCVHGWPELWYSWRHQLAHFAPLGFTVQAAPGLGVHHARADRRRRRCDRRFRRGAGDPVRA